MKVTLDVKYAKNFRMIKKGKNYYLISNLYPKDEFGWGTPEGALWDYIEFLETEIQGLRKEESDFQKLKEILNAK